MSQGGLPEDGWEKNQDGECELAPSPTPASAAAAADFRVDKLRPLCATIGVTVEVEHRGDEGTHHIRRNSSFLATACRGFLPTVLSLFPHLHCYRPPRSVRHREGQRVSNHVGVGRSIHIKLLLAFNLFMNNIYGSSPRLSPQGRRVAYRYGQQSLTSALKRPKFLADYRGWHIWLHRELNLSLGCAQEAKHNLPALTRNGKSWHEAAVGPPSASFRAIGPTMRLADDAGNGAVPGALIC
ncbi:hypothetical protein FH972_022307 [Carpinus fangiana]|uniref:Uncharacterized protein n=1 Tax=Carpinus fangiana TaxID=176857 RepID=A0A5N6KRW0_9ROSI|nr:hypothetical protein FH972_022307 [Carpinus fangiana]